MNDKDIKAQLFKVIERLDANDFECEQEYLDICSRYPGFPSRDKTSDDLLIAHLTLCAVEEHGGFEVYSDGDGFIIESGAGVTPVSADVIKELLIQAATQMGVPPDNAREHAFINKLLAEFRDEIPDFRSSQ